MTNSRSSEGPSARRTAASTFHRVAIDLTHAAFGAMAAALRARIGRILTHWRDLTIKAMPDLRELTLAQFENAIGAILSSAADALQSADPQQLRGVVERAPVHGVDRFVQEHSVLDLFEEVRILRGVVILELAEEMGRPLYATEAATFHAIFDIIIQQGVMALVQSQHQELQLAQATTRDMNERLLVSAAHQHELTERTQESEAALRESEAELQAELAAAHALQVLTNTMLAAGDDEALFIQMVDTATAIMRSDFASMQVLDPDRHELLLVAQRGFTEEAAQSWTWIGTDRATSCGAAFRGRRRSVIPDVERCEWLAGTEDLLAYRQTGIVSVQSTPLTARTDGRVIGMISTHWRSPHTPNERELRWMDAVARQAADMLERRETRAALRQSEANVRMLADNMDQLAWTCDTLGNVTWYNRRWLEYTGLSFEEMKGGGWSKVQHPEHLERVVAGVKRAAETGEPWEDSFPLRGKEGGYHWFLSRAVPIRDDAGRIVCWFGTNTDVTVERAAQMALQERETELARAAGQLSKMNRAKDEFLAMLSHELRNPIAPIRAAVHLMRTQERGSENLLQQQAREIIERQVGNLTKIVNDLLEVSRVVSGRIHLSPQVVDVNQIVRHAVETSQTNFDQHKHVLSLHLCDDGAWVNADATRLEEVFVNLLNNAAKYTPDGGRVEVHCEQPPGTAVARVRVRDNGVGIDKDLLEGGRLFDLFTQADRSLARSAGGLGIGLSLAHRLVHLHGGTIEVKSPPEGADKGSEFIVGLPLAPAPPEPETSEPTAEESGKLEGIRVLLVDDNIDLVMMLASSLRQKGYSVQVAYTGPDGLRTAQEWRPDVVLLDIGLPGMDGYEVARRIRSAPALGNIGDGMRLVAVTGYGRDADLALAQEAGFDAHLTKPVEFKELESVITALYSPER